eukprot:scaffold171_cov263-Pinguiococcus_pyrenoidosus.AAC.4
MTQVFSPSDVAHPGAFSSIAASLPATMEYATSEQRAVIAHLGKTLGAEGAAGGKGGKKCQDDE